MKWLLLAVALVVPPSAMLAARPLDGPSVHAGTWHVEYWEAGGEFTLRVSEAAYRADVAAGSCGPRSHVSLWPRSRTVSVVCQV
ncbi:MAG: hypothetical protein JWM87_755 [Candidatus Eremiobacteraeota bacterium]|nr:hypothetical protein [Candidatus Eremiobacteraeota bacterium]